MEWRPVPGYEGLYEVSDVGQVRSFSRQVRHYTGAMLHRRGRVLRGCVTERGYVKVSLCKDGAMKGVHVHVIVAAAFKGPRPPGAVVRHWNGDASNNCAANVFYGTYQDNSDDMARHGTVLRGAAHGSAKLNDAQVLEIRKLRGRVPGWFAGACYGVSEQQVSNIWTRRQWRHL